MKILKSLCVLITLFLTTSTYGFGRNEAVSYNSTYATIEENIDTVAMCRERFVQLGIDPSLAPSYIEYLRGLKKGDLNDCLSAMASFGNKALQQTNLKCESLTELANLLITPMLANANRVRTDVDYDDTAGVDPDLVDTVCVDTVCVDTASVDADDYNLKASEIVVSNESQEPSTKVLDSNHGKEIAESEIDNCEPKFQKEDEAEIQLLFLKGEAIIGYQYDLFFQMGGKSYGMTERDVISMKDVISPKVLKKTKYQIEDKKLVDVIEGVETYLKRLDYLGDLYPDQHLKSKEKQQEIVADMVQSLEDIKSQVFSSK